MKKYLLAFYLTSAAMTFVACNQEDAFVSDYAEPEIDGNRVETPKDNTIYHFIVASQQKNTDFLAIPYIVKTREDEEWTYLWEPIEGFDYEAGYEYQLTAHFMYYTDGEMQDCGIGYYKLIDLISKEKKESAGIEDLVNPKL